MTRRLLLCIVLLTSLRGASPAMAVDYFWTNSSGGAYDEPSHWTPFAPPGTQGPGGPNDTVNFDLGVDASNRYVVTDAGRENDQLIIHNDSVELTIFVNHALLSTGGANPSLVVGAASGDMGDLILSAGGASVLETEVTRIGNVADSTGIVRVQGLEWNGGNLRVGYAGEGSLVIDEDASVSSTNASVAHLAGSIGQATVDGAWDVSGNLVVGRDSDGDLNISPGGAVSNGDAFVGHLTGSIGVVIVESGSNWTTNGRLSIAGDADSGASGGVGVVSIAGVTTVSEDIVLFPNGFLSIAGGSLSAAAITVQTGGIGFFQFAAGSLFVDEFNGNLSNQGGVLAPRPGSNSIMVSGEYTQGAAGTLSIEIAGTAASNQYDSLIVDNTAFLGGELQIRLVDLFEPGPAEVYTIVDALNFGVGSFSNVANGERVDDTSGLGSFVAHYGPGSLFNPDQVVLTNFLPTVLPGDYNGDGTVDAADYVLWRKNDGSQAGYDTWRDNFGQPAAGGAGSSTVPEPATWLSLAIAGLASVMRRSRCRRAAR